MMPNKATSSSFQNHDDHQVVHQHHHHHHMLPPPMTEYNMVIPPPPPSSSSSTLLYYYLSILKEKLSEVQTLVGVLASPQDSTTSMVISTMISTIQEIIVAATSMRSSLTTTTSQQTIPLIASTQQQQGTNNNIGHSNFLSEAEELDWFSESYNSTSTNTNNNIGVVISDEVLLARGKQSNDDIIELDAADLLARYTHFCQVCGKGFKRDANLRMHMRAHGDEYKTNAALKNNNERLLRNNNNSKKYSCPEEGCRWNKKHERFQPLKSMICVKNHYKRSHCPKMYVCKRCNMKQFSVLSDLRTHEKHCGHPKWHCSCGTTFSRKDKLLGHLALFLGHVPATTTASSSLHHL